MSSSVYRPRSASTHDLVQVLSEGEEEGIEEADPSEEKSRFRSQSTHIGTTEMGRLAILDLHMDSEPSMSPDPEERRLPTPDPEDPLPRPSSALLVGEMSVDGDLEETDPEMQVTFNPLFLQPMPESADITLTPMPVSTLPEPKARAESLELALTTTGSVKVVNRKESQEEPEDPTEPNTRLESTEENLPLFRAPILESETFEENEQSVDGPVDEYSPNEETESVPSREETRSLGSDTNTQASSQVDSLAKYQPVAAPRLRRPLSEPSYTAPLRRRAESSASESERESSAQPQLFPRARATPVGQEREVSVDSEKRRPNSGSFSISSARRRSKIVDSGDWNVTNANEFRKPVEPLPKSQGNKDTTDQSRDQPESPQNLQPVLNRCRDQVEENAKESPQKHPFAPEKRTSLRREVVPNGSVSRTVEETTDLPVREAKVSEGQSKTETAEEKRNAFGVTLRSTSLSLKFRSESAQSEARYKRHSLEASYMRAISEDLSGPHVGSPQSFRDKAGSVMRAETANKASTLGRQPSMNVDFAPPVSVPTGSSTEDLKSKEPAALTRLRDRGFRSSVGSADGLNVEPSWKSHHQSTGQSTSRSPTPESLPQGQLRSLQKTASVHGPHKPAAKPPSLPPAPKPTARVAPDRPMSWATDRTAVEKRWDCESTADEKKATLSSRMNDGTPGDHQTKNDFKPEGSSGCSGSQMSSSSPPLQRTARSQPSWMELAKRKSLAWNDKSLD